MIERTNSKPIYIPDVQQVEDVSDKAQEAMNFLRQLADPQQTPHWNNFTELEICMAARTVYEDLLDEEKYPVDSPKTREATKAVKDAIENVFNRIDGVDLSDEALNILAYFMQELNNFLNRDDVENNVKNIESNNVDNPNTESTIRPGGFRKKLVGPMQLTTKSIPTIDPGKPMPSTNSNSGYRRVGTAAGPTQSTAEYTSMLDPSKS